MGTGAVAGLLAHFHFHQPSSKGLEIATLLVFFLNLVFFVSTCGATIARYYMFPEVLNCPRRRGAELKYSAAMAIDAPASYAEPFYRGVSNGCCDPH